MSDPRIFAVVPVLVVLVVVWRCRAELVRQARYRLAWWRLDRAVRHRDRLRAGVARDIAREVRRG